MKTADTIEQQEKRKAARDNGSQADSTRANTPPVRVKMKKLDTSRIAHWKWQPGRVAIHQAGLNTIWQQSLHVQCFENNREALYKAFSKAALRGNAYAFKELADRAYGKLKETHQVDISPYKDVSDEDLAKKIKRLEVQLGYSMPEMPANRSLIKRCAGLSQRITYPLSRWK